MIGTFHKSISSMNTPNNPTSTPETILMEYVRRAYFDSGKASSFFTLDIPHAPSRALHAGAHAIFLPVARRLTKTGMGTIAVADIGYDPHAPDAIPSWRPHENCSAHSESNEQSDPGKVPRLTKRNCCEAAATASCTGQEHRLATGYLEPGGWLKLGSLGPACSTLWRQSGRFSFCKRAPNPLTSGP
jgi:hypothetical protein